jgi:prepilin-type N-terminal cleavage/methylation domain-containing protein
MIHKITSNLSRGMRHFMTGQGGFTLIELLVVVIILGVLAAVVTVNVSRFAGRGQAEAQNTERDNVQLAIDALMAESRLTAVIGNDALSAVPGNGVQDFTAYDFELGAGTLNLYPDWTRQAQTSQFYCWNDAGEVTDGNPVQQVPCP